MVQWFHSIDINQLRGLATLFVAIAFAGVCWWAFSRSRKKKFADAAKLPFADETLHKRSLE